jgi:hypothetical protein
VETPDRASIWRFRQTIDKLGLSVGLLTEVNRRLDALGFVIKRGTAQSLLIVRPPLELAAGWTHTVQASGRRSDSRGSGGARSGWRVLNLEFGRREVLG